MKKFTLFAAAAALSLNPAIAVAKDRSSGNKAQEKAMAEMPHCAKPLGTIAIVEPDNQWWREMSLGSPEMIMKVFIQESGCFKLVNRGRSMQSRAMERAMADEGELQRGSNLGRGQVKAADYFLEPNIVTANGNSGGGGLGGALGALGGGLFGKLGGIAGSINIKKKEANVTLSIVNARTTEEEALTQGYYRKTDIGFGGGVGSGWWSGFGDVGGYANTDIGQVIVLAYLDAYAQMIKKLGGLPADAAAAAPQAK